MYSITNKLTLNNIFNPLNFTMTQNTYNYLNNIKTVISTKSTVITSQPIINPLKIFNSVSLYLNDQILETINEDTFNIMYYYFLSDEKRKQLDKLITLKYVGTGWKAIIPLTFWFYYISNISIPLIAMPYTDLVFKYKLNNIKDILLNNINNVSFSTTPTINIEICLDTILLDTTERLLFGQYRHEYIIERYIIYPQILIYKENQIVNLRYTNLVKDIFWITKPINNTKTTSYNNITNNYDSKYQYYSTVLDLYNKNKLSTILTSLDISTNIIYINDFKIIRNNNTELSSLT